MARLLALGIGLAFAGTGCGDSRQVDASQGAVGATTTGGPEGAATTVALIDSQAILDRYGFTRCDGVADPGDITAERGQEILFAAVDAGIAQGGSPGGDGSKAVIFLFVADDPSLATLAGIAQPAEVCVTGQDPNDYVPPGPQALEGPGWKWVGAGSGVQIAGPFGFVTDQATYDRLWPLLGEGPETDQLAVDFDRQVILTINHGSGVTFGPCGLRFDGFSVEDGTVVLDLFSPGGNQICPAMAVGATYAVALDLDRTGPPPFEVASRMGPRREPQEPQPVAPDVFATTTSLLSEPEPTTTAAAPTIPPTAPAVSATAATGQPSAPAFAPRVADADGTFDLPVPAGWERDAGEGRAAARITGRGALEVQAYSVGDDAWKAAVGNDPDLVVVAGPTAVVLQVYGQRGLALVTTGEVVTAQEYRYASRTSFLQVVVRWWERDGRVVVARLNYPDPAKVSESLTGLDPDALLDDIRILR